MPKGKELIPERYYTTHETTGVTASIMKIKKVDNSGYPTVYGCVNFKGDFETPCMYYKSGEGGWSNNITRELSTPDEVAYLDKCIEAGRILPWQPESQSVPSHEDTYLTFD